VLAFGCGQKFFGQFGRPNRPNGQRPTLAKWPNANTDKELNGELFNNHGNDYLKLRDNLNIKQPYYSQ